MLVNLAAINMQPSVDFDEAFGSAIVRKIACAPLLTGP